MFEQMLSYAAQDFTAVLPVRDYVAGFRDAARFEACCRACPNYGRSWGCPPFEFDAEEVLARYRTAFLIATKIVPDEQQIPISEARRLILPERRRLENCLREMEKRYDGHSFAYAGTCLYCPEGTCARRENLPCRHPELVRPSLEAFGFNIGKTTSELFGIELKWGQNGMLPEYLTLVCGFFHNADCVEWNG